MTTERTRTEKPIIRYCKTCIIPDTRPEIVFNEDGICDACISNESKYKGIDWDARKAELNKVLEPYRRGGKWYDCIVPVSGGKNSWFQAWTIREVFGMNPLLVNFVPCSPTELGRQNLERLKDLGFDMIHVAANRQVHKRMNKVGFFKLGDPVWPQHIGIFTSPFRVAYQYKIPLIIWGENPHFEYGGPAANRSNPILNQHWLEEFQMQGYRLSDLVRNDGFTWDELKAFTYPTDAELAEVGVTGIFLGHYVKWDNYEQYEQMTKLGFLSHPDGRLEGTYWGFENLDCKFIGGLYEYMKFIKYGYGRATDQLNLDIRSGRLTRARAVELARELEGKIPWQFVGEYLDYLKISKQEFLDNLDKFTNRKIFLTDESGKLAKDKDGNPIKRVAVN